MSRFSNWTAKDLAKLNVIQDGGTLASTLAEAKPNKFGAVKTESGGVVYDSKMEAGAAEIFEWQLRSGEVTKVTRQVRIPLVVEGVKICDYVIDFVVEYACGITEYVEVKGCPTPAWKLKWKLFRALYPELNARVIWKEGAKTKNKR